jgi:DNA-binding NarL/FixJ family response regulator
MEKGTVGRKIIQVLLVDDMPQVRQGLATMLELATKNEEYKIEVVGEAQDGEDAIKQAQALHPDVILMDLEMPVLDGFRATHNIKLNDPSIFIIVLTIHDDLATRQKAALAGADSFIAKSAPLDGLIRSIIDLRWGNNKGKSYGRS